MEEMEKFIEGPKVINGNVVDAYYGSIYGSVKIKYLNDHANIDRRDFFNVGLILFSIFISFFLETKHSLLLYFNYSFFLYSILRVIILEIRYIEVSRVIKKFYALKRKVEWLLLLRSMIVLTYIFMLIGLWLITAIIVVHTAILT